jgi:hypothetical protein
MKYGKRLFPYPTLNAEKVLSQYAKSTFSFSYDLGSDAKVFILKNAAYRLENDYLESLVVDKKAKCYLLVDCPQTHFRKLYLLGGVPKDIEVGISHLSGRVNISAYLVASEDIVPFTPNDLSPDYAGFESFIVEKNDVIAVDDGYMEKVECSEDKDNIVESIFTVISVKDIKDEIMRVDVNDKKIVIKLPEEVWTAYKKIGRIPKYQNIVYGLVLIPALVEAIGQLKSGPSESVPDIEDLKLSYSWFSAFCKQYQNVMGHEIDPQEFKETSSTELAQRLMGCVSTRAVTSVFDLVINSDNGGEEDE